MPIRPALLIARIRARRATRPTMRRVPKQAHPLNIEREYARTLDGMMSTIHQAVLATLLPMFKGAELVNRHDATKPTAFPFRIVVVLADGTRREVSKAKTLGSAEATAAKVRGNPEITDPTHPQAFFDQPIKAVIVEGTEKTIETVPAVSLPKSIPIPHGESGSPHAIVPRLKALQLETERTFTSTKAGLVAQGVGVRTSKFNRVAIGDQIKAVIGVDPLSTVEALTPGIIDDFVAENVSLIQSIPERYFSEVNGIVSEAVSKGTRASDVSAAIQARYSVSQSRASLIARDQVSKLNGKLTETRQKGLGISRYTWRTSLDERVRDTHQALEGTSHSWDSPPSVGHPGEDFQCRCRAEPDLSALLGD
jgi:SPP1 gp7 family putative phage head morphogenesis protein